MKEKNSDILRVREGEKREKKMKKENENKGTEKARILAGVEFGKWLFMEGSTKPHNTIVTKQADTMRSYGLEIDVDNWESVECYSTNFLLIMRHFEDMKHLEEKIEEEETK